MLRDFVGNTPCCLTCCLTGFDLCYKLTTAMKIVNVIEKYDGRSDAAKWLERFEAAAIVCGIAKTDLAAVIPIMFSGPAHDVYT